MSAGAVDVDVGAVVVFGTGVDDGSRSMFFASSTAAGSDICCACDGTGDDAPPTDWGGGPGGGGGKPSSVHTTPLANCPRRMPLALFFF